MRHKIQILLVAIAGAGLVACGSGDDVEEIECSDGTVLDEDANECIAEQPECDDDEQYVEEQNRCVRVAEHFCAEDTEYDEDEGVCTAAVGLTCGEDVTDEDDECVPAVNIECGAGTVVLDGQCVPSNEVCAEGTVDDDDQDGLVDCRPEEGICGEGTTFDLNEAKCIPLSVLECGPGTVDVDGYCESSAGFFEDLAEDPDLDMSDDDGVSTIDVDDSGEPFVFLGNIDEPEMVDGEAVQQQHHYEMELEAGDWVEISVYSLGLPEPGYEIDGSHISESAAYYRLSDLGAGVEVTRQIAAPYTGTYDVTVGNLPQMLDMVDPAGGDDWEYVGYVEQLDAPDAEDVDILEDSVDGDVTELLDNLYYIEDMDDVENIQMLFQELPDDADGEMQVWSDETTFETSIALDDSSLTVTPPGDDFYLLFDRIHAYGSTNFYDVGGQEGQPLAEDDVVSEDIDLDAGEYVGVSQFNTQGEEVSAYFYDDDGNELTMTDELVISIADEGKNYLYWLATDDQTVTVELENDTGDDLDSISYDLVYGMSDAIEVDDGDLQTVDHSETLTRGQRHFVQLDFDLDELLMMRVLGASSDAMIRVYDDGFDDIGGGLNEYVLDDDPGDYAIVIDAQAEIDGGFTLEVEETDIFDTSETSSPDETIPDNDTPATDVIDISSCSEVLEIDMDVEIFHGWRGDLIVSLENPEGTERYLKARYGGSTDDIIGNFNGDLGANDGVSASVTPELIEEFEGDSGTGEWTLIVLDDLGIVSSGTLSEWTLNLTCQG